MSVELRSGESQDSILRRFRKSVAESRILPIVRQKRWYTSKSEIRRIKKQKAIRKANRPPLPPKTSSSSGGRDNNSGGRSSGGRSSGGYGNR